MTSCGMPLSKAAGHPAQQASQIVQFFSVKRVHVYYLHML